MKVFIYNVDVKKAYDSLGKNRYNYKIFYNKTGPRFGKKQNLSMKSDKNKTKSHSDNVSVKPEQLAGDDTRKKKFKEQYMASDGGFSMGIAPSKLDLKKERRERHKKLMNEFNEIMFFDNINYSRKERPDVASGKFKHNDSYVSVDSPPKERVSEFKIIKPKVDRLERAKSMRKRKEIEEINKMEELKKQIDDKNVNRVAKPVFHSKPHKVIHKEPASLPGPASYDVRTKIEKKGFSFGSTHQVQTKEKPTPDFVLPKTDFEIIHENPKFAFPRSERFKKDKLQDIQNHDEQSNSLVN